MWHLEQPLEAVQAAGPLLGPEPLLRGPGTPVQSAARPGRAQTERAGLIRQAAGKPRASRTLPRSEPTAILERLSFQRVHRSCNHLRSSRSRPPLHFARGLRTCGR